MCACICCVCVYMLCVCIRCVCVCVFVCVCTDVFVTMLSTNIVEQPRHPGSIIVTLIVLFSDHPECIRNYTIVYPILYISCMCLR